MVDAETVGWVFVGSLVWVVILGLFPSTLFRIAPARFRTNSSWGVGGRPLLVLMLASPVALMVWWSHTLRAGQLIGSGLATLVTFGIMLGLPASAVSLRAWRTQRVLVRSLAPAVDLGLREPGVNARSVTGPTTSGQAPPQALVGVATNRLLRRARTVLIAVATLLYTIARLMQWERMPDRSESSDPPGYILVLLLGCVIAACALTIILRVRHRLHGRGSSIGAMALERGWRSTDSDAGQLAARFPLLPLLGTADANIVSTKGVVWACAGDRRWWAVDQAGAVRDPSGLRRSTHRSMVIVSLPQAALPRIVIAGRDLVRVRDWLGDSMRLESEDWNRRIWVWCLPDASRYAHAVLHPRAVEHVLATLPDGMALVVAGDALAAWRDGPLIAPDLEAALHCVLGMADLLPDFVLKDYASNAQT